MNRFETPTILYHKKDSAMSLFLCLNFSNYFHIINMNEDDLLKDFASRNNIDTSNMMSITQLFDSMIMQAYDLDDAQYDYICEHASDTELDLLVKETLSYNEKRQVILIVKKYKELHATSNSGFDF